jgi:type II secretory pathway pseudopilin PulG
MSRHFWHACNRGAGFSFVELLVTIIIAGIAFAAMVPVFVQAQQVSSGEQMRNVALQLAQDKLEKVRGLDYDLITQANLQSSTFADGQFGTSVSWATGGGNTRTFNVTYLVELLPVGSTAGNEQYKQVTITAAWTGEPSPVKAAQLSTMVSQQYAGPQIIRFTVSPLVTNAGTGAQTIESGPVILDAYILPDDILSMNQAAAEANRGYVQFSISSLDGSKVASSKVTSPVGGEPARYQFTWDNSAAADGVYIFQAVAVAGFGSRAQGLPVSIGYLYENHRPPPPTGLSATAGDVVVRLQWVTGGDLDHYEVERSEDGVSFAKLADTPTEAYEDTAVTNGTTYYYRVRTIDPEGFDSVYSEIVSATPNPPVDSDPPSVPAPLAAAADADLPIVHLSWPASVDAGTPTSGLLGYTIERSTDGATGWVILQSGWEDITFSDTTATWSTQYWYRVKAVDVAGNASAYSMAGPVTTRAVVYHSILVRNNSSSHTYVWVQDIATSQWYTTAGAASATRPSGVRASKNGGTLTWSNLPRAGYNVYFLSQSSWSTTRIVKTQVVNLSSADGTATYP